MARPGQGRAKTAKLPAAVGTFHSVSRPRKALLDFAKEPTYGRNTNIKDVKFRIRAQPLRAVRSLAKG